MLGNWDAVVAGRERPIANCNTTAVPDAHDQVVPNSKNPR